MAFERDRSKEESLEVFDGLRPLLFSIAYRMLGSVMDAEDVLQDAYLRWTRAREEEVRSPRAYLSAVTTRLCIDRLRAARTRREEYVGPWLPEPLLDERAPAASAVEYESLSLAFLVLLESLTPVERAVFLLREVFDYDYAEVARIVGKSEANCRQISRRARTAIAARRPRFDSSPEHEERLLREFARVCATGDMPALLAMLSEDITLWSDGGGKTRAARHPIHGPDKVARFLVSILTRIPPGYEMRVSSVNGGPGIVGYVEGSPIGVVTIDSAGDRIHGVRIVVNPEKLGGIPPLAQRGGTDG